jgi:hypothetical protein
MPLYQLQSGKVNQLKQVTFPKEKELQKLFEGNLSALLGVRYVASEFSTRWVSIRITHPRLLNIKRLVKITSSTRDCFI